MSTERSAERAGGTVADAFGDPGNPDVGVTQQLLRERHAPCAMRGGIPLAAGRRHA